MRAFDSLTEKMSTSLAYRKRGPFSTDYPGGTIRGQESMRTSNSSRLLALALILSPFLFCTSTTQEKKGSDLNPSSFESGMPSDVTVGLSMKTLSAPYFVAQVGAIEERVRARGMDFIYIDAQDDIIRQVSNVEDLLARGIDLLIMNPLDPKALVLATKSATRAGVPIIIIDSSIDPDADFVTNILSNNLRNGEMVGEWLAGEMGGRRIQAAVLSGAKGNPVGKERRQGVFRGIIEEQLRAQGETRFDLVVQGWGNWTYEGGLTAMEDILVAHPDINVLISEQDAMALGARQAIGEAGKKDEIIIVSAADGQKEAFEMIMKGEYGATGLNNPVLIAEMAVDVALKVLAGERDFPKVIYTPAACISRNNVDEYYDPDAVF
jgi:ribose transport system substrate-binding protein